MKKFDYNERDSDYWRTIDRIISANNFSTQDVLRYFAAYVMRRDTVRFIAHYELFKNIIDLPGCVVELGVFRGASFFTWSNLMETFCPGDRTRKVFGFDHFEGLSAFNEKDGKLDDRVGKVEGGYASSLANIEELVRIHNDDNFLSGIERCRIINGDVQETLPVFLEENPGLKIALLHLDLDTYDPTRFALEQLYDRVLRGGVIVLDEYALVPWQGETRALDEFIEKRNLKPVIKKFNFAPQPHAYFIKD